MSGITDKSGFTCVFVSRVNRQVLDFFNIFPKVRNRMFKLSSFIVTKVWRKVVVHTKMKHSVECYNSVLLLFVRIRLSKTPTRVWLDFNLFEASWCLFCACYLEGGRVFLALCEHS